MTIAEQIKIKAVENLKGNALREKFREVTGLETRSNNRPYLIKRIVHALQARTEGVPDAAVAPKEVAAQSAAASPRAKKPTRTKKEPAASTPEKRQRDPRRPAPGTIIEREHEGKTIKVKVLDEGFEFRGKTYRSLSAVAREATGTIWNGILFFHLIPYAKREKKAA